MRLTNFDDNSENPEGQEGFWIRNGKSTRATRDIVIENLYFTGVHDDEMVAIFNFAGNRATDARIRLMDYAGNDINDTRYKTSILCKTATHMINKTP